MTMDSGDKVTMIKAGTIDILTNKTAYSMPSTVKPALADIFALRVVTNGTTRP
jgi:hypothetical protein